VDDKNREELQQDVEKVENTEIEELSEGDLESIAGGESTEDCDSGWCCTSLAEA